MHVTCIHAAERAPLFLICPMVCLFDVGAGRKLSAPMKSKRDGRRSRCPISFALDSLGDKWTLLVLRDLILFGKKHYGEFSQSEEKIASNILADRLKRLKKNRQAMIKEIMARWGKRTA